MKKGVTRDLSAASDLQSQRHGKPTELPAGAGGGASGVTYAQFGNFISAALRLCNRGGAGRGRTRRRAVGVQAGLQVSRNDGHQ